MGEEATALCIEIYVVVEYLKLDGYTTLKSCFEYIGYAQVMNII